VAIQQDLSLSAPTPSGSIAINARCMLRSEGEQCVVLVAGLPVHHYSVKDAVAEAYAMVLLVDGGYATQKEVGVAFGCSERTVRRHQDRYADRGMTALATRSGWRPGRRRVPSKRARIIEHLKTEGVSNREIARRLGVTEKAIRKQVGPSERQVQQQFLAFSNAAQSICPRAAAQPEPSTLTEQAQLSAPPLVEDAPQPVAWSSPSEPLAEESEPVAMSLDVDPTNRVSDRLLACLGLLEDAAPVFGEAKAVPSAGVLCALPVLVASGIFASAHKIYGQIGPAFYGLRTTLLTLLLMALWRVTVSKISAEELPWC